MIRLQGGGEEGLGEDVTYDADNQIDQQVHGPVLPLAGGWTVRVVLAHLGELDTFPAGPPKMPVFPNYRRWAFESAALDLALRQAGARSPTCSSASRGPSRSSSPRAWATRRRSTSSPRRLAAYPDLRFKLDGTPDWGDELIAGLVETGAVDSIDFKGAYKGTAVDVDTDPAFYAKIAETFPDAWLEDPDLEDEAAREALRPYEDRITWDAPIHSIDDILAAGAPEDGQPQAVAVRLDRGAVRRLRLLRGAGHGRLRRRPVRAVGVGRGQIQYLAAIFHPDAPNDIAPAGYDALDPEPGLPASPLEPEIEATGFRRRT